MRELVLMLVWGAGGRIMAGRSLLPKPRADLVKNGSMVP